MKKIYTSLLIFILAVIGLLVYTNYQNNQLDKEAVRAVYKINEDGIYNGLILANTKGDWNKYNTYLYFPNEKQLLDNLPQCVEPTKVQAEEFLKAYKKVYKYILKENLIKSNNPQQIGKYSKQVLDFIYNYQSFEYFRDLYAVPEVNMYFNAGRSLGGTTLAEFENYYKTADHDAPLEMTGATPESLANAVFSQAEQKDLAKAEGQLLTQVSENCVQAGYGKDFYSIWWAGLPSQGVSEERASQVGMMYDIFYKAYLINMTLDKINLKQKREGKVWQIIQSKEDFIKEVFDEMKYQTTNVTQNVLNVLTAEILQDDFKNENYSIIFRVISMGVINDYYSKGYILEGIKNSLIDKYKSKEYFFYQNIIFLSSQYYVSKDKSLLLDIDKKCKEYSKKLKVTKQNKIIKSYQLLSQIMSLKICNQADVKQYNQIRKLYL